MTTMGGERLTVQHVLPKEVHPGESFAKKVIYNIVSSYSRCKVCSSVDTAKTEND